jgi:uncharacterized protein (TIRG00374 family)
MAVSRTAPARRHSPWVRWGRYGVSAVLLAILLIKIDPSDFVPPHRSLPGTLAFLFSGLLLMALSFVVGAWRWQRTLAVYDQHIPMRILLKHYFAGQFVGNALPSTVGGDVLRISRCSKDTGSTEVAFASVVLERLTGFVALPLLTLIGFTMNPSLFGESRSWIAIVTAVVTLLALGAILLLAASPRLAGRFVHRSNWTRFIGIVHVGVDKMRHDKRDALGALAAAFAYQMTVLAAVYCAVHTIGLTIPNGAVFAYIPAVAMVQVLPISVGGLGVREGLLALLLVPLGVPTGQAVALGLLWYAMTIVVSVAGAPAFAIGHHGEARHHRPRPAAAAADRR